MRPVLLVKHIACEGAGYWERFWAEQGRTLHTVELWRGDALPSPEAHAAIMVMGGPMNVDEEDVHPFLAAEKGFIRRAVQREVPLIGFCLGGQLLARALGAPVTRNPIKEIGFFPVQLTAAGKRDPLFAGFAEEFEVFQWHGDTFALPEGAVHLAASPLCTHQAFRCGRRAWGLQFHLEATPEMVEEWVQEYAEELAGCGRAADGERLAAEARDKAEAMKAHARLLFENFYRATFNLQSSL